MLNRIQLKVYLQTTTYRMDLENKNLTSQNFTFPPYKTFIKIKMFNNQLNRIICGLFIIL